MAAAAAAAKSKSTAAVGGKRKGDAATKEDEEKQKRLRAERDAKAQAEIDKRVQEAEALERQQRADCHKQLQMLFKTYGCYAIDKKEYELISGDAKKCEAAALKCSMPNKALRRALDAEMKKWKDAAHANLTKGETNVSYDTLMPVQQRKGVLAVRDDDVARMCMWAGIVVERSKHVCAVCEGHRLVIPKARVVAACYNYVTPSWMTPTIDDDDDDGGEPDRDVPFFVTDDDDLGCGLRLCSSRCAAIFNKVYPISGLNNGQTPDNKDGDDDDGDDAEEGSGSDEF